MFAVGMPGDSICFSTLMAVIPDKYTWQRRTIMSEAKKRISILLAASLLLAMIPFAAEAESTKVPEPVFCSNLYPADGVGESEITVTDSGYERIFEHDKTLYAESYDSQFNITGRRTIPFELEEYGGYYRGTDYQYIMFGRNNPDEKVDAEVIRVVKYDFNWNRIGAASLTCNRDSYSNTVTRPFDYCTPEMAECNGTLYVVTGRETFADARGYNHQGFMMFAVDEDSMTGRIVFGDGNHSFTQHIASDEADGKVYVLQEEEFPRKTSVFRMDAATDDRSYVTVLKYGGSHTSSYAIPTCATADGTAFSKDTVLTVGSSIDQSRYSDPTYQKSYNMYVTVTPKENFSDEATTLTWLGNDSKGQYYRGIHLTRISDDRFLLMWERGDEEISYSGSGDEIPYHKLHYLFLNSKGVPVSDEFTAPAALSGCDPAADNGKAVFYASAENSIHFYTIDGNGRITDKAYQPDAAADPEGSSKGDSGSVKPTAKKQYTDLPAVKIAKPSAGKRSITVKWKKVSKKNRKKIAGIQIQYSTDRKFKKNAKTVTAKKTASSKKIKRLKSKKKYYVRVRAYKKAKGKMHISKWSKVKSVRTG